ncbi:uncharacterized protein LOC141693616 [Apium graveolens]|uniref:uncharacterized protein LOC141693616 n=1 Tax=Apium graveolens TaxID=4045 RepID=UPI003D7A5A32
MSSSTTSQEQDHYHYAPPSAPPPTPSSHSISTSAPAIDNLSQLFNRFPPNLSLSLPKRRPSHLSPISPVISLPDLSLSFSRAFELGFFHLTDHNIPSHLAKLAETESLSLFHLSREKKLHHFPQNWPLGYEDDKEEDVNKVSESFCFDSSCYGELAELKLESLREFTQEMEKVGLHIIEAMSCALGFDNPTRQDPTRICSQMWVSEETPGNKQVISGKMYPYVVGLQYQLRGQKSMMFADSGLVSVPTRVESVLVTLGDIAQVWSNGKLKKVRGRPIPSLEEGNNSAKCITMTLLLTLPLDSTVSTLIPKLIESHEDEEDGDDDIDGNEDIDENKKLFKSFSFEDYAWRMYHEQHVLKDPLDRYYM